MNQLASMFSSTAFIPHGMCLLWQPGLLLLHAISDSIIALSYFSIPAALGYFLLKRRDIVFPSLFILFALFILGCGTTHVFGVWTLWHPDYGVDGAVKAATALVSIGTAIILWRLMPQALALPSPRQLAVANRELEYAVAGHQAAERRAQQLADELERRVRERTAELEQRTRELSAEIDTRRAVEAVLRESEAGFHYLFENSPLPKWVYDTETLRFLAVNDAAITTYGYSREEFGAMRIVDIRPPEDVDHLLQTLKGISVRHQSSGWRHRCKDGRLIDVDIFSHNLVFDGRSARMVVALDVTARKTAEEQLRQAQKMDAVGQLTGGLAHDFNNLLAVIIGNLALLREMVSGQREPDELAREAHDAARRGADLTRSLLAFARQQSLQPERVDLNALVAQFTTLLRRTLGERIEISLDLLPDAWPVVVDRAQLEAAIANLATNARDAMPKGGHLTIATTNRRLDEDYAAQHREVTPGDYVMLQVNDTGTGMSSDVLAKVFEPFFTTKGRGKGTGLGLAMVFGFMKQSGGHINVYSEVGVGTTFRLYLPRDRASVEADDSVATAPAPLGRGERILVVEDNEALRRLVLRQLGQLGYHAQAAENAAAAVKLIEEHGPFDLVFTDIVMAGKLDGFDLARIVVDRWPRTRIVMTSGFPGADTNGHAEPLRNVRLLSKPYLKEDLARTLREAMDGDAQTE